MGFNSLEINERVGRKKSDYKHFISVRLLRTAQPASRGKSHRTIKIFIHNQI